MNHKVIPAIEQFLDEAEAYRFELLKMYVDEAWNEMQILNRVNVGATRVALEQAKKEKDTIRDNFDKTRREVERTFAKQTHPIYDVVYDRFRREQPDNPFVGMYFEECATPEEKKAIAKIYREQSVVIKKLKTEMGLDNALAKVRELTALLKSQKELETKQKAFWKRYPMLADGLIFYCTDKDKAYKWCHKESRLFRENIKADIFARTFHYIGEMYDMEPTSLNAKLNLNGIAYGEKGKCKVWTIIAGGYNIQKEHYRCLVKNI